MSIIIENTITLEDVLDLVDIAVATVSRRLPAFVCREDLASVGKIALVMGLPSVSGQLDQVRAQCYVKVRSAILDEIRRLDPLSRRQRKTVRAVTKAASSIESRLGRTPSTNEIAAVAGISEAAVIRAQVTIKADDEYEGIAWDALEDDQTPSPSDNAEAIDVGHTLVAMITTLTPSQAAAVRLFYFEEMTLEEIGSCLSVSTERARQLRDRGIERLRVQLVPLGF